jgi:hypothetical protein
VKLQLSGDCNVLAIIYLTVFVSYVDYHFVHITVTTFYKKINTNNITKLNKNK